MVTTEFWAIGMASELPGGRKRGRESTATGVISTRTMPSAGTPMAYFRERGPGGFGHGRGQLRIHTAQAEPVVADGLDARSAKLINELLFERGRIGRVKAHGLR